jgi:hypothetical protein
MPYDFSTETGDKWLFKVETEIRSIRPDRVNFSCRCKLTEEIIQELINSPIQELSVSLNSMDEESGINLLRALPHMSSLSHLYLENITDVWTFELMNALPGMMTLDELIIRGSRSCITTHLFEGVIIALGQTNVRKLKLNINLDSGKIYALARSLTQTKIRNLVVEKVGASEVDSIDELMKSVCEIDVESLSFDELSYIQTTHVFHGLWKSTKLHTLKFNLSCINIDAMVDLIEVCPTLRTLYIEYSDIDNRDAMKIVNAWSSGLPQPIELYMRGNRDIYISTHRKIARCVQKYKFRSPFDSCYDSFDQDYEGVSYSSKSHDGLTESDIESDIESECERKDLS